MWPRPMAPQRSLAIGVVTRRPRASSGWSAPCCSSRTTSGPSSALHEPETLEALRMIRRSSHGASRGLSHGPGLRRTQAMNSAATPQPGTRSLRMRSKLARTSREINRMHGTRSGDGKAAAKVAGRPYQCGVSRTAKRLGRQRSSELRALSCARASGDAEWRYCRGGELLPARRTLFWRDQRANELMYCLSV